MTEFGLFFVCLCTATFMINAIEYCQLFQCTTQFAFSIALAAITPGFESLMFLVGKSGELVRYHTSLSHISHVELL